MVTARSVSVKGELDPQVDEIGTRWSAVSLLAGRGTCDEIGGVKRAVEESSRRGPSGRATLEAVPTKIRCVTFDCYGTLIDWESGITKALSRIPALFGQPERVRRIVARREQIEKGLLVSAPDLPEEETADERYEALPYRPYREILAESIVMAASHEGVDLSPGDAVTAAASMSEWEPFPDTRGALARIKAQFPIGILSNVEDEVIAASIKTLGVDFDLVITAEKVGAYKPSPDHWYAAMHELEADEEEIFHLAASPFHDLETATLLGIPCGYVNRAGAFLLPEAQPLFTVKDLDAAASRLKGFPSVRASKTAARGPDRPRRPPPQKRTR